MHDSINGSDYGILNCDSPTRVQPNAEPSSPDVSLTSNTLITSCSWQTLSILSSDHLPILIRLQMKTTTTPDLRRTYVNLKKANWDRYIQEVEAALSKRSLPTDCKRDEKIFRTVLLKAVSHHIPTGQHRLHEEPVPAEILDVMTDHSTTSAQLQMTTDIAMGLNQRKPPDRTIFVPVDLSAAFDTVYHKNLLSKINRSQLHTATARWLSWYLRGRQANTCFRGVKSTSRKVSTSVPKGSKLPPSLFSVYIADMPRPTEPVKRVFYADDLTMWATGAKIPGLEDSRNNYIEEITAYLKDNSLLISAPKSSVTFFSPDPHRAKTHPRILIGDSQLPLVQCPKILGVYLDTSLSFTKHSGYVAERVSSRRFRIYSKRHTQRKTRVGAYVYDIPGSGRMFTTYPGRGVV